MAGSRSVTPTLNAEPVVAPRQSAALSTAKPTQSRDTLIEEESERAAANTNELRPAEGPGSRQPVPEKFAHTGRSGSSKCVQVTNANDR
jgi:hypothetical protein